MCEVVDPGASYGWAHDYGYQVWADSKKHGNTLIGTLRKTYGPHFAKGCADDEKLSDVLHKLDEPSLSALVEDHEAGTLEAGECVDAELNPPRLPYRCPLLYGPRRTGPGRGASPARMASAPPQTRQGASARYPPDPVH